MELEDSILDFLNYCIFEKGLSDKTKESYHNDLEIYKEFLQDKNINRVEDITSDHIKEFLKVRSEEETTTIAHNLTVIKNYHTYLLKEKLVKENVSEFIERPKLRKALPKTLSIEDIEVLKRELKAVRIPGAIATPAMFASASIAVNESAVPKSAIMHGHL